MSGARRLVRRTLDVCTAVRTAATLRRGRPGVALCPSNHAWDPASNLRVWLVAPELRRLGWRVTVVPPTLSLAQRRLAIRLGRADVVFLQQTRHSLNDPALYPGIPCVLDADDADYLDPRHRERIARCAAEAAAVVGGSRFVTRCLAAHNPVASTIWTCTPEPTSRPAVPPSRRDPIVTWAHGDPFGYPHEASLVQEVMRRVAGLVPGVGFRLFGTDDAAAGAYLEPIRRAGATCEAIPKLRYEEYLRRVGECAVGLQPISPRNVFAAGKSFGKVLAYLVNDVPVVASDAVDHGLFFRDGESGFLVRPSPGPEAETWAAAVVRLLREPELRDRMAARARAEFLARLTTREFARRLSGVLARAAGRRVGRSAG